MKSSSTKTRSRKKLAQQRQRAMIQMAIYATAFLLGITFLIRGIIFPVVHLVKDGSSQVKDIQISANTDPHAAMRVPLRSSTDVSKLSSFTPGWHTNEEGTWYQNFDGTYYANGFQAIDNEQYYFTENGYLATGWVTDGAKEFYFDESGHYQPDKIRPRIALTFDDGPGQYTDRLLDSLEANGAHATFFMVGQNVGSYAATVRRMLNLGCELGNHSWDHANLPTLTEDQLYNEFSYTDEALRQACGQGATIIRPPYGASNDTVLSIGGRPSILWCVDSLDWSYKDAQLDYQEIMKPENLTDGSIILMHDIHEPSVACAERIISELTQQGYRLLTVSELAESKGVSLQCASYTDFWDNTLKAGKVAGYESDEMDVSVADFSSSSEESFSSGESSSTAQDSFTSSEEGAIQPAFTSEETGEELTAFSNNVFGTVNLFE